MIDKIFRDKKGHIVIWQNPNIPLWVWIISRLAAFVFKSGHAHSGFQSLAAAALITWAYLEIRSGASLFRRILGAIVLVATIYGFFVQ